MSLIADIYDVSMIDDLGNVIGSTTLQNANIEVNVKEQEVRTGRGNQLISILHSDRDINISLEETQFKYDWLAKQLGQSIVTAAGVAYTTPKFHTITGTVDLKITLDETPISIDSLAIFDITGTKLLKTTDYTLSAKEVTIKKAGLKAGDKLEVRTYSYNTSASTQTISIDNTVFPDGLKLILETIEIDNDETPIYKVQWQFDEALVNGSFAVNTQSERNAVATKLDLRVIKPVGSNVVGRILRIPIVSG